jgi:hypothetical protein
VYEAIVARLELHRIAKARRGTSEPQEGRGQTQPNAANEIETGMKSELAICQMQI